MHDISLLVNVAMLLVTAFAGGLIARRLALPSIVGYLVAGMAIGPFTPGFVGDIHDIRQLAELGVIFLMFGVGLHFSLRDLWAVRGVAIPGAALQMVIATLGGYALAVAWGWSTAAALLFGFAISIASTVVVLRNLMDSGLLNTLGGKISVGWLVLEDLVTIFLLVLLPVLFGDEASASWQGAVIALVKAAIFVVIMLIVGARLLPWLFMRIAFSRSRELFVLAVVAAAVGIALGAAQVFGVSLALGAFLAGVVLGESPISHHIGAEVVPFRDLFTVKDIPDDLYEALKQSAAANHRSINREIIYCIERIVRSRRPSVAEILAEARRIQEKVGPVPINDELLNEAKKMGRA